MAACFIMLIFWAKNDSWQLLQSRMKIKSEAENRFGKKPLKRNLRAVPGCRCQIAQNHYQTKREISP